MFPDNKQGIRIIEGSKTSSIKHFTIKIYTAFKKEKFISLQLKKKCSIWTYTKPEIFFKYENSNVTYYAESTHLAKTGSSCSQELISKHTYVNLHN